MGGIVFNLSNNYTCKICLTMRRKRNSKRRTFKKVIVSPKFYQALQKLKRMKCGQRKRALSYASNQFIRDLSKVLGKVRHLPLHTFRIQPKLMKQIKSRRKSLQTFVSQKSALKRKRRFLNQKGDIVPALIPIIAAAIAAGGSVVSAGVGAAIARA